MAIKGLYIIAGHGAGDPGATGGGYNEATLVRKLADKIKAKGGDKVIVHNKSVNVYASGAMKSIKVPSGYAVVELHMDSASASARGGHVIISSSFAADAYDKALAAGIAKMFPGRAKSIVKRNDLYNLNVCANRGINYRLVENGFISNSTDRSIFLNNLDKIAELYLTAAGLKASTTATTTATTKATTTTTKTTTTAKSSSYKVKVTTAVLNVRAGAGTSYKVTTQVKKNEIYTITAEKTANGYKWGKLKSGAGWIALKYTTKV